MANGYNTTTQLDNSVIARYEEEYLRGAAFKPLYREYASGKVFKKPMAEIFRGSSVTIPFLLDLEPVTQTISQVYDVNPVQLNDTSVSVTPTSRINAITDSELLAIQGFSAYTAERFFLMGKNMDESVDFHFQNVALQGGNVYRGAARASLDSGTAAHLLSSTVLDDVMGDFMTLHVPGWETPGGENWACTIPPYAWNDLRTSNNVLAVGQYQNQAILLKNELGQVGRFRLAVSPWAKTFWGAGAANASAIETTLSAAAAQGATSITVADATNIDVGDWITIGTIETANTHNATNARAKVTSVSGTTIGVAAQGPNGGLRFAAASGATVTNDDSVATGLFGGPSSLAQLWADGMGKGMYGNIVGPKKMGAADQFTTLAWSWYGAAGRVSESWLIRGEFAVGRDS